MTAAEGQREQAANGAALAAFLGAGIGALALGLVVILNEAGVFAVVWPCRRSIRSHDIRRSDLVACVARVAQALEGAPDRTAACARDHMFILIWLGLLLIFPPVWKLVS
ncbi:MAG: hypothetical protein ACT4R6_06110 [Gemmatimonadaceae bacterium]